jgi:hypothetical protein
MIGGLAVNHWAIEPMATADVDVVTATEKVDMSGALVEKSESGFTPLPVPGGCKSMLP